MLVLGFSALRPARARPPSARATLCRVSTLPSPPPRELPLWLRPLAVGAVAVATIKESALSLGASPTHLLGAAAAVSVGLAVADRLPSPSASRRRGLALGAAAALPLLLLGADRVLGAMGALVEGAGLGIRSVNGGAFALAAAGVAAAAAGGTGTSSIGAAVLGASLAAPLPPALGGALGALLLALRPATAPAQPCEGRGGRALGVLGFALAGALTWLATRATLDPTPTYALTFGVAALLGGAALGFTRRTGPGAGALLAGLGLVGLWAPLSALPVLAQRITEAASTADATTAQLLLLAPGAALGLGAGALGGAVWGPLRWRDGGLALAAGLALAPAVLDQGAMAPLGVAALLAMLLLAGTSSRAVQLGAVGLGGICFWVWGWVTLPSETALTAGAYSQLQDASAPERDAAVREGLRSAWTGWSSGAAASVRAPPDAWERRASGKVPYGEIVGTHVEIDGLVAVAQGRAGDAEAFTGLLARLLANQNRRALLLGDDTGRAARTLVGAPGQLDLSTPLPETVRAIASLDAGAERAWLLPGVRLRALHPSLALRLSPSLDMLVEISRAPWADSARAPIDARHLDLVADRLGEDGVYALCLHLVRSPAGAPQAIVSAVAQRFSSVTLWMPPTSADSLILTASQKPFDIKLLEKRADTLRDALSGLGFDAPLDVAGFAVADREAALGWASEAGAMPSPMTLSDASFARPLQHLASLSPHLAAPGAIWEGADASVIAALEPRIRAHQVFLEVLKNASEGDMEAVFERARALLREAGTAGSAALDTLIEPHLSQGRAALKVALKDGLSSPAWDAARAAAVTAQMLNPQSAAPLELLGEIDMAQGKPRQAQQHYEEALAREPDRVSALTGAARAWRLQGDVARAEDALRKATRAAPRVAATWQNLGVFLIEQQRWVEAEECLRRAAGLDEASAAPHLALAELALALGDNTRALVESERAVQLEKSGYGWYLRGRAHFELGQLDAAEEDFRGAVLAEPRLAEARGAIGHIQALRGDLVGAAESYKSVLALEPDNAAARENLQRISELQAQRTPQKAGSAPK